MSSRERFRETMRYGSPDRVPYFEEGLREEVLSAWHDQGLAPGVDPVRLYPCDSRHEILPDLEPHPGPEKWPTRRSELDDWKKRFDAHDPRRLPDEWPARAAALGADDQSVVMLRVHRGFFLSLGVYGWDRLVEVADLLSDDPALIHEMMSFQGDFTAEMAEGILQEIRVDAAIFAEPIGGNDRPLISPRMYENFVLGSYEPLLGVLRSHGVATIMLRTYANARILIPSLLRWGFNCLWACEVNTEAMDYRDLRREFGRDLRLIGGIDLDALRGDQEDIRREIEEKVPPLLADGGYVPLADGRVRADVPYRNYLYYRRLLAKVTSA